MDITIYTSNGCVWCSRTRELMERAKLEYKEINWQQLDGDTQVSLTDKHGFSSFPAVIIDEEFIGGLVPLAKLLMQKGFVQAPSKK